MTSSKYQQKSFTTFGECYIHFLKTNLKKSFCYCVVHSLVHLCMEKRFENLHAFLSKRDTRRTTILSNTAVSMATGCQHVTKMWFLKLPCPSDHLCQIFKKSSEKWRNMCLTAVSHVKTDHTKNSIQEPINPRQNVKKTLPSISMIQIFLLRVTCPPSNRGLFSAFFTHLERWTFWLTSRLNNDLLVVAAQPNSPL